LAPYTSLSLRRVEGGTELPVRAIPGASRNEIGGVREGALLIKVTSQPERGKANQAITRVLATTLGVRKSQVSLSRGDRNREKTFLIGGVEPEALRERLRTLVVEDGEGR